MGLHYTLLAVPPENDFGCVCRIVIQCQWRHLVIIIRHLFCAEPSDKKAKGQLVTAASQDSLASTSKDVEPSLVLILKWGGELTPAGKIQAEELGKAFRCMYPGGQGTVAVDRGYSFYRSCM